MENLNNLVALQIQVRAVRLQDKLSKQNFHEDMKTVFEPVTKSLKNNSEILTKTTTETSSKNKKAIENLNNKLLEKKNNRGILASFLIIPLSKITNPENTTQFKLVKDAKSNRVNDLKINKSIPITLYNKMLTFRDTGREFEIKGDVLEMITNKNYNVDLAKLSDKKLMYDFAKELNFDLIAISKKSTRDRTPVKILKSAGLMVSASGVSKTLFLSSDPNELCDRLKLLLRKNQAGSNSDIINQEIVATVELIKY